MFYYIVGIISSHNKDNLNFSINFLKIKNIPGDINFVGFIRNLYKATKNIKTVCI